MAERRCGCNRPRHITWDRCGWGSANLWRLARSAGLHPTPCSVPGCAADRHRVSNDRTLPNRPGGTSGIFRNTGKHHFLPRMATAATPENPDGSCSLPHHPGAPHPSRGSRSRATRFQSTALADGGHAGREPIIRSRPEIPLRPGASQIGMLPTIKPPDTYQDRSQSPDRTVLFNAVPV